MLKRTNKKNNGLLRKFIIFLIFEGIFTVISFPLFVFYGPFKNVKEIVVDSAMTTLSHQYIAKVFLSDKALSKMSGNTGMDYSQEYKSTASMVNVPKEHSDKIELHNIEGDFQGKLLIIHDPSTVVVGYSSRMPESGETTSSIARRNNAIAAINAGGFVDKNFVGTGGMPEGFIFSKGECIFKPQKKETEKLDTVALTEEGKLVVGRYSMAELKKMKVRDGVSFGPPLIVDGKPTIKEGNGGWGIAPRTAIGQRATGEILFLVIDGRSIKSLGAYLVDVQNIFLKYKAVNAANLDGGSSTTMYYKGQVINRPCDNLGERTVPSVFMVLPLEEVNKK